MPKRTPPRPATPINPPEKPPSFSRQKPLRIRHRKPLTRRLTIYLTAVLFLLGGVIPALGMSIGPSSTESGMIFEVSQTEPLARPHPAKTRVEESPPVTKNRVGEIFSIKANLHLADELPSQQLQWEIRLALAETASGIPYFLNSDPAGFTGGMNFYAYSAGDPNNLMDPLGLGPADSERYTWVDGVQDGVGLLGFIPAVGAIPDGVNGVVYLFRGKWADAGFSFAAAIPFAGDLLAAGKYADKLNDVRRIADGSYEIAEGVRRSKAAIITGQENIMAKIVRDGHPDVYREIPLSSLLSPKEFVDARTLDKAERFAETLQKTRKAPVGMENAIEVRLGTNGVPIGDVKIKYPGSP